ncbi:hypothetical protein ACFQ02_05690 [Seminibacterium arietis]|uniref:Uncharacterized protein n=1 Tax=Seminibacterium arietis TaxID=1173502 RepID=A0ABW3IAC3_9PAST
MNYQWSFKKNIMQHMIVTLIGTTAYFSHSIAIAANVPAGTQLADKQEVRLQLTSELASIDPHKTEGAPEHFVESHC